MTLVWCMRCWGRALVLHSLLASAQARTGFVIFDEKGVRLLAVFPHDAWLSLFERAVATNMAIAITRTPRD